MMNPMPPGKPGERGATAIQITVLMVPVFFGLMGFAVDLGRLYLVRGELNQAAQAMALAAAPQLIGTVASTDNATTQGRLTLDNSGGFGNKYNFGSLPIGGSTGLLTSDAPDPAYYATAVDAIGTDPNATGSTADGTTAKYVRVTLNAEAPLLFWGAFSFGQERKVAMTARAVAGVSAPLCTACAIEAMAVAALDQADTTDFGFLSGTRYTFGYQCTGAPAPAILTGASQRIPYLLLNHLDSNSSLTEDQQLYRTGAQGLLPGTTSTLACIQINTAEQLWASAAPLACNAGRVQPAVTEHLCGLTARFDPTNTSACTSVTDVDTLSAAYAADTDVTDITDYTTYIGTRRRLITVPVVDALSATGDMTVLGFRQFLLEPNPNDVTLAPTDANGRFNALYIGSVAPVRQGRFDGGCGATSGPGKVVLHQ